jgi:RNA polymerase sigma-70 factor (ECF subfamily)
MNGYDALDDHQLLARVSDQEPNALDALYSRYASAVYSLAMFMLKDTGLAEEATQDIFLNIWLKSGSFKPDRGQPKTWIMSVAHHRIIDLIRSRRRTTAITVASDSEDLERIPAANLPIDEQVERKLERERIQKSLATLPEAQREVIRMAYFDGYSQSEIATLLNQPLGTVKTRVRLAMQKLRLVLQENVVE